MRTHHVKKARKSNIGNCESCGKPIKKGDAYKLIKPRYGSQRSRHETCPDWRESEKTSSDKLSTLYAAQEALTDALKGWSEVSELADALNEAASSAEEARDGYTEAADADEKQGAIYQSNTEKADAVEEWISTLQDAASEVEGMEAPDECANCQQAEDEHTDHEFEQRDECDVCGKPADATVHLRLKGEATPESYDHDYEGTAKCAHVISKDADGKETLCELAEDEHTDHEFEQPEDWRSEAESAVEDARDALNMP